MQLYSGNFLQGERGKDGVSDCRRGGVCLETQYYPNSLNYPQWKQPITRAGEEYKSETVFVFGAEPL
jgi:aldose 1-epimerase